MSEELLRNSLYHFLFRESAFFWLLWVSERSQPAGWRSVVDNKDQLPQSYIMLRSTLALELSLKSQGTSAGNPRSRFIILKPKIKHPCDVRGQPAVCQLPNYKSETALAETYCIFMWLIIKTCYRCSDLFKLLKEKHLKSQLSPLLKHCTSSMLS